jgi:NADPH:quinone reductase
LTGAGPATLACWRIRGFGEPSEVLERGTTSAGAVSEDDVLIGIDAVALNFLDVSVCRGEYSTTLEPPLVPGAEVTGRALDVGANVTSVRVGDRVSALSPTGLGGFAEAVVVPSGAVCVVPDDIPTELAAGLLVTYHTAHVSLVRRARVQSGEWVLIHAGAGGTGSAAIQIATSTGARVISTSRSEAKAEVCRSLGAEVALNLERDDLVEAVLDATGGRGADVILDPVGGDTFRRSLECIAFEGRLIPVGWAGGVPAQIELTDVLRRNITLVGVAWGLAYPLLAPAVVQETHERILDGYRAGSLRPLVRDIWEFAELPQAVQALADGAVVGKAVVRAEYSHAA